MPSREILNELKLYNPELLDKQRVLAITKCDLIDEEIEKDIAKHLPRKVPHVFISSTNQQGLKELKDILWNSLTKQ